VELESLTFEEIEEVRSSLNNYECYVQLKRLSIHPLWCKINIFRVIVLGKYKPVQSSPEQKRLALDQINGSPESPTIGLEPAAILSRFLFKAGLQGAVNHSKEFLLSDEEDDDSFLKSQQASIAARQSTGNHFSMSSMSSNASGTLVFNRAIKDFKKELSERNVPRSLLMLGRVFLLSLISTLALCSLGFYEMRSESTEMQDSSEEYLIREARNFKLADITSNVQTLLNIASGLEPAYFTGDLTLSGLNRFDYLVS
jgi:hypothetical protein